jgi:hypothetical protein
MSLVYVSFLASKIARGVVESAPLFMESECSYLFHKSLPLVSILVHILPA